MKAVQCVSYGPNAADALKLVEVPKPQKVREGCLLIEVLACGVDFVQTLMMQNKYQLKIPLPFTLGGEATGKVVAIGEGVEGFEIGDLVHGAGFGCFCEYLEFPAFGVIKLAPETDPVYTPSLYSYMTAIHALKSRANLEKAETLLVLGASGGVGSTAVQIGKLLGATVIAAASTAEKLETCKTLGADHVINYTTENLKLRVRELTDGKGVNVVFDPVGDKYCEPAVRSLSWRGRYIVIGFAAGEIPSVATNLLLLKEGSLLGSALREASMNDPMGSLTERNDLIKMHNKGLIKPFVSNVVNLKDAAKAFDIIQNRIVQGKVVLVTDAYERQYGGSPSSSSRL